MIRKIIIGIIGILIVLLLLSFLILKSHTFQSFLINRITNPIERNAEVDIEFSKAGFDVFEGLFFNDLNISDKDDSELLAIDHLSISPKSTIFSLIQQNYDFSSINLNGLRLNVSRSQSEDLSNWDQFLKSFQSEEKKENTNSPDVFVRNLNITDVKLVYNDEYNDVSGFLSSDALEIVANEIDLANMNIDLEQFIFIDPLFHFNNCKISTEQEETKEKSTGAKPLHLRVKEFKLIDANIQLASLDADAKDKVTKINGLDALLNDLIFNGVNDFSLVPKDINLTYNDLIDLDHSSANRIAVSDSILLIDEFLARSDVGLIQMKGIITASGDILSNLGAAQYDLQLSNSKIDVNRLGQLLPDIAKQKWYRGSNLGTVHLNADMHGSLKQMSLSKVKIIAPDVLYFDGDIDISDVSNLNDALMNASINHSKINVRKLASRFKNVKIPDEIKRLGELEIEGLFDGFSNNFVAESQIKTELGDLNMDLNFDFDKKNEFSGFLELISFDLGALLNSQDIGVISLQADIEEGSGADLESMKARLQAKIDTFEFKNYTYQNAFFNGNLSNKAVAGQFNLKDQNADFAFDGTLDFSQEIVTAKFDLDLNQIELCQLNLTNFPCYASMSGFIDMYGKDLNSLQGTVNLDSIVMRKDDDELQISYLDILSSKVEQGMLLDVASDEIDAKIRGVFDLRTMHKVLLNLLVLDYPDIAQRLNIKAPSGLKGDEEFDFAIDVKDMGDVLKFVKSNQLFDIEGELRGRWSSQKGLTSNSYNLSKVGFNGLSLNNVVFNLDSEKGDGRMTLLIDELIQGSRIIDGFEITSRILESDVFFNIKNHDDQENRIDVSGKGNPWGEGFKFVFENNVLRIDSIDWILNENAQIGYRKNEILIDNFILDGDGKTLVLDDIDGRGISLNMNGFPLALINPIVDYDKMYFEGSTQVDIQAKNIFDQREVSAEINVPDFTINGDDYGSILIKGNEGSNGLIDASVRIQKDTQSLDVLAYYDLKEQLLNADISIVDYPMSIFEYIIDDGISRTSGTTDINARIFGPVSDLSLQGQGVIKNGGTRIDYIGEYYRMEDQVIKIDENKVYLTGVELLDHLGNVATIEGHLNHDFFADFSTDLTIGSDKMIGLFTTKEDNDLYFGTGLGAMTVSFSGPFSEIDIKVVAEAGEGSALFIPLESSEYSIDKGFVNFNYKDKLEIDSSSSDPFEAIRLSGADFEMNLSFTPEADVFVIFDQSVAEILSAKGSGDLRVTAKRDGTFEVFGNYLVESGDYLYSAYGVTAKRFLLRQGGVVRWTGDPYNALLNVEADYTGMRAPLDVFLSEFLVSASEQVRQQAKSRTDVGLQLKLGGTLFKPDVNFGISFPDVSGELKTYTDNKMRALSATENGINNQVFGLMVFNNFLPSNNPIANLGQSAWGQTGNNTITEFFSSQLSLLVSSALSDLVKDGSFINDIDLDIALSQNTSLLEGETGDILSGLIDIPDQFGVNVRPTFNNDNWALNVGTNYVRASEVNNVNYLTGDFALDWFITDDKKLKLRFYGDFNYDEAFASRRQKYGFGINYRREFGKMSELTETLKEIAEKVKLDTKAK